MKKRANLLKVWAKLIKIQISHDFAYPLQFFLLFVASLFGGLLGPLFGFVVYGISSGFPGWTLNQYLLLFGSFTLVRGFSDLFFTALFFRVGKQINRGLFDKNLLRPIKTLPFLVMQGFDFDGISTFLLGFAIVGYALHGMTFTLVGLVQFAYLIVLGICFMLSITMILIGLSLVFVEVDALRNFFFMFLNFARYPISVFGKSASFVLSYLIPIGLVSFYPAKALGHGLSGLNTLLLSLAIFVFMFVAKLVFNYGISKYQSAGG